MPRRSELLLGLRGLGCDSVVLAQRSGARSTGPGAGEWPGASESTTWPGAPGATWPGAIEISSTRHARTGAIDCASENQEKKEWRDGSTRLLSDRVHGGGQLATIGPHGSPQDRIGYPPYSRENCLQGVGNGLPQSSTRVMPGCRFGAQAFLRASMSSGGGVAHVKGPPVGGERSQGRNHHHHHVYII